MRTRTKTIAVIETVKEMASLLPSPGFIATVIGDECVLGRAWGPTPALALYEAGPEELRAAIRQHRVGHIPRPERRTVTIRLPLGLGV